MWDPNIWKVKRTDKRRSVFFEILESAHEVDSNIAVGIRKVVDLIERKRPSPGTAYQIWAILDELFKRPRSAQDTLSDQVAPPRTFVFVTISTYQETSRSHGLRTNAAV